MIKPVIVAQFILDPNGVPIIKYKGKHTHYRMKLMIRDAPEDAYAVTYELDETYYEPVRESRRRSEDFVENLTSYGDYTVRATVRGKQRTQTLVAKLSEALALGHAKNMSTAIATAFDYIKTDGGFNERSKKSFLDIIDQIKPALVAVLSPDGKPIGTGFFVTSDGYILTCYHVVEALIEYKAVIQVKTSKGIFDADYVADKSRSEKYLDWAVLKIKEKNFSCLHLLAEFEQNDEWYTIGYELSEWTDSVSNMGVIVGPINRIEAASSDIDLHSLNPIRGGVSGSPVFNKRTGSVTGLIREGRDTQAFATSIESILRVWPELKDLNLASCLSE